MIKPKGRYRSPHLDDQRNYAMASKKMEKLLTVSRALPKADRAQAIKTYVAVTAAKRRRKKP